MIFILIKTMLVTDTLDINIIHVHFKQKIKDSEVSFCIYLKVTQIVGNNEQFDLEKKKPSHFWRYINCQYDKVYVSHIR